MTSQSPLRIAIAGAGLMGRWHARTARRAGARVVAIVDRDRARAEELCVDFSGCRAYQDLSRILGDVDVIHICTPSATHLPLATEALNARRHVLVEKPLAPTAADVAALLDLASRHNVLLCPVHQILFQDGVQLAIARLPAIGSLRHVSFATCSAGAGAGRASDAEHVAHEILPHPLSLLARLLPTAERIDWSVRHPAPGEIRALAQIGEVTVSLLISMSGRPTSNTVELIGTNGTTSIDLFHGFAVTHGPRVSRLRKGARPFTSAASTVRAAAVNLARRAWRREPAYPGLRRLVELFYGAVAGEEECPLTPAETLMVAREGDRLGKLIKPSMG